MGGAQNGKGGFFPKVRSPACLPDSCCPARQQAAVLLLPAQAVCAGTCTNLFTWPAALMHKLSSWPVGRLIRAHALLLLTACWPVQGIQGKINTPRGFDVLAEGTEPWTGKRENKQVCLASTQECSCALRWNQSAADTARMQSAQSLGA